MKAIPMSFVSFVEGTLCLRRTLREAQYSPDFFFPSFFFSQHLLTKLVLGLSLVFDTGTATLADPAFVWLESDHLKMHIALVEHRLTAPATVCTLMTYS